MTLDELQTAARNWADHYKDLADQAIEGDAPAHAAVFAQAEIVLAAAAALIATAGAVLDVDLKEGA